MLTNVAPDEEECGCFRSLPFSSPYTWELVENSVPVDATQRMLWIAQAALELGPQGLDFEARVLRCPETGLSRSVLIAGLG